MLKINVYDYFGLIRHQIPTNVIDFYKNKSISMLFLNDFIEINTENAADNPDRGNTKLMFNIIRVFAHLYKTPKGTVLLNCAAEDKFRTKA